MLYYPLLESLFASLFSLSILFLSSPASMAKSSACFSKMVNCAFHWDLSAQAGRGGSPARPQRSIAADAC